MNLRLEKGYDAAEAGAIPGSEPVRVAEMGAWLKSTGNIIAATFGDNSPELTEWRGISLTEFVRQASDRKESAEDSMFHGTIDYLHTAIGLLTELNAKVPVEKRPITIKLPGHEIPPPKPTEKEIPKSLFEWITKLIFIKFGGRGMLVLMAALAVLAIVVFVVENWDTLSQILSKQLSSP